MKLVEGNYYETVSGVIVGPMVEHDKGTTMPYFSSQGNELKALLCNGEELEEYQRWESNGKVFAGVDAEDCHVIVREVAAPFRLEDGKSYVLASGDVVTMTAQEDYFVSSRAWHYNESGECCYRGISDPISSEDGVRRSLDVIGLATSSAETLTLKIGTKEAQSIVAEAAKEFEASADKLLSDMAGVQAELRAAKDAFNILHFEKEELALRVENQMESLRRARAEINRLDEEVAMKDAFIAEKEARIKRCFGLVKSASARNIDLSRKNEALGIEVLRLSEALHTWSDSYYIIADRKLAGDNRLRRDRAKLKAERARSAAFEERAKDAEEQLRMYSSGRVVVRNGSILLAALAIAFAAGGFFF